MDAHPALRGPALSLALLPVLLLLLGELSCSGSPSEIIRAAAPFDVSAAPEQASARVRVRSGIGGLARQPGNLRLVARQ